MFKDFILKNTVYGASQARALLYSIESLPLPLLNRIITKTQTNDLSQEQKKMILKKARNLLQKDSEDFTNLSLPLSLLRPESPIEHFSRFFKILGDSAFSFFRRKNKQTRTFSNAVKNLDDYPEYYQRNFHHQTDGYLSDSSASLYEHQVELLFRGLAEPMRRRLLKPLIERFKDQKNVHILELGCGTGAFTRALTKALPNAKITALDLSPNYIKHAKKSFITSEKVNFMCGDCTNLPFKDSVYDGVISIFLHHELPEKIRKMTINESHRVCKENGFWGMLDSIQIDDDPDLNFAILDFPKTFHEPFFKNYIDNPILTYLNSQYPLNNYLQETSLLSKVIYSI